MAVPGSGSISLAGLAAEKEVEVSKMTAYFKSDKLQKFLKKNDFKDFSSTEIIDFPLLP